MTAPNLQPFESLWDANDVAAFLKVSRSWVYQRAEAGTIPHHKIGGLLRFDPGEIRAWTRAAAVQPATIVPIRR